MPLIISPAQRLHQNQCEQASARNCGGGATPITFRNGGGRDSFTLGQGGFVLGGPFVPRRVFFFVSAERQVLNASKEGRHWSAVYHSLS